MNEFYASRNIDKPSPGRVFIRCRFTNNVLSSFYFLFRKQKAVPSFSIFVSQIVISVKASQIFFFLHFFPPREMQGPQAIPYGNAHSPNGKRKHIANIILSVTKYSNINHVFHLNMCWLIPPLCHPQSFIMFVPIGCILCLIFRVTLCYHRPLNYV